MNWALIVKVFMFICVFIVAGAFGVWLWSMVAINNIREDDE